MNGIKLRRGRLSKRALLIIVALLTVLAAGFALAGRPQPTAAQGAEVAGFIKFIDLSGESTDAGHVGWSDVISFEQGKSSRNPSIEITKVIDKISPKVERAWLIDKVFEKVEIELTKPSVEGRSVFYAIVLKDVTVYSYVAGGTVGMAPQEVFVLRYRTIELSYRPIDAAGGIGAEVKMTWTRP